MDIKRTKRIQAFEKGYFIMTKLQSDLTNLQQHILNEKLLGPNKYNLVYQLFQLMKRIACETGFMFLANNQIESGKEIQYKLSDKIDEEEIYNFLRNELDFLFHKISRDEYMANRSK